MTDATEHPFKQRWRIARLSVAAVVLVGYAIAAVLVYRECSTASTTGAPVDKLAVVTTCAPPTLTSATVLALLLLLVLLLWPDISEITVLGVTLKRKVEEAKQDASAAKDEVAEMRLQLVSVRSSAESAVAVATQAAATAASSASANVTINNQWRRADQRVLREEAERVPNSTLEAHADGSLFVDDADWLTGRIIREWDRLQGALNVAPDLTVRADIATKSGVALTNARRDFVGSHRDVLQTLRQLRNAVAQSQDVPLQDMKAGVDLLSDLNHRLEDTLGAFE